MWWACTPLIISLRKAEIYNLRLYPPPEMCFMLPFFSHKTTTIGGGTINSLYTQSMQFCFYMVITRNLDSLNVWMLEVLSVLIYFWIMVCNQYNTIHFENTYHQHIFQLRVQCQYTLFSYGVSYNISTLCCKVVLGWPRPNATNDEANKWGDLVYGVPKA